MYNLSRKNNLGKHLMDMRKKFPEYKFFPKTATSPPPQKKISHKITITIPLHRMLLSKCNKCTALKCNTVLGNFKRNTLKLNEFLGIFKSNTLKSNVQLQVCLKK